MAKRKPWDEDAEEIDEGRVDEFDKPPRIKDYAGYGTSPLATRRGRLSAQVFDAIANIAGWAAPAAGE